jgi:hypothetical protein
VLNAQQPRPVAPRPKALALAKAPVLSVTEHAAPPQSPGKSWQPAGAADASTQTVAPRLSLISKPPPAALGLTALAPSFHLRAARTAAVVHAGVPATVRVARRGGHRDERDCLSQFATARTRACTANKRRSLELPAPCACAFWSAPSNTRRAPCAACLPSCRATLLFPRIQRNQHALGPRPSHQGRRSRAPATSRLASLTEDGDAKQHAPADAGAQGALPVTAKQCSAGRAASGAE